MRNEVKRLFPAIVCALALPVCALVIRPFVEMGLDDDWSYIKTAQLLAQTGHIVYNGWASAILGWPLYLAALLVKVFGFSFTVVRSTTLLIAAAAAFLVQRTFVRSGVREWNAVIGTLSLILSPLFLALTFGFMTDIPGFFCIVLCIYSCIRAIQSSTDRSALAWVCFAALSNTVGGTVRQIAWLGVLVIVPATLWILRRRPRMPIVGSLTYLACAASIFASLHWFMNQPYSLPEHLLRGHVDFVALRHLADVALRSTLEIPLFLLPVLLMFIPAIPRKKPGAIFSVVSGGLIYLAIAFVLYRYCHRVLLAPFLGNYVTVYSLVGGMPIKGGQPIVLHHGVRLLLTLTTLAGVLCFFAFLLTSMRNPPPHRNLSTRISWHRLGVLLIPFSLAYLALLLPRAAFAELYDRYLLPLLFIALLLLLRIYQEQVLPRLPVASFVVVILFAVYSVAAMHDLFSMYRARLAAVNELRAAGIPATAIDGGLEYNGWTEIERVGYVNNPRIVKPAGAIVPSAAVSPLDTCQPFMRYLFPAISSHYAIATDPNACGGEAGFAPVTYHTWLAPHTSMIYIVRAIHPSIH